MIIIISTTTIIIVMHSKYILYPTCSLYTPSVQTSAALFCLSPLAGIHRYASTHPAPLLLIWNKPDTSACDCWAIVLKVTHTGDVCCLLIIALRHNVQKEQYKVIVNHMCCVSYNAPGLKKLKAFFKSSAWRSLWWSFRKELSPLLMHRQQHITVSLSIWGKVQGKGEGRGNNQVVKPWEECWGR